MRIFWILLAMSVAAPLTSEPVGAQSRAQQQAAAAQAAQTATGQVVDIPTRSGKTVRAIQLRAQGRPRGSVILIAGGHGNLSIGKDGSIAWGKGIHLVRARGEFARAGYAVLLPDIAQDHKKGEDAVPDYRASVAHAMDLGALVSHMRKVAQPVLLIGTDKGAVSVANAAVRLAGANVPDAIAILSGTLMHVSAKQPSVERLVPGLQRIQLPVLLVNHQNDGCRLSSPRQAPIFRERFLSGARKVEIKTVGGGTPTAGDQCEALTPHGFAGQDGEIVRIVSEWAATLDGP